MFTIDATITDLKIADRNLIRVLFSMNNHQVANPETSLEEARSYVFFFREGGKIQAYVGLYFISTDRRRYYSHSSNPFPEESLADVEDEARSFAEGLGAMLDELDFAKMSPDQRKRWIEDQEFLSGRKKETKADAAQPAAAAQAAPPAEKPVQTAPPVQPAPVMQPQELPVAPQSQPEQPPAPVERPQPPQQPSTPAVGPADRTRPAQVQPSSPSPRRAAPPAQEAAPPRAPAPAPEPDHQETTVTPEVVFEEAVKAGVAKAPMAQLKKDVRSATGMVSREKEALARLLASF